MIAMTIHEHDDPILATTTALREVLGEITFTPSCLDMGWGWEIREVEVREVGAPADAGLMLGWLISTSFQRPDRETGSVARGRGREMWVPNGATLSAAVKTAWVAARLIVDHELMECFKFKGERVFDPHATIAELTSIGRGNP